MLKYLFQSLRNFSFLFLVCNALAASPHFRPYKQLATVPFDPINPVNFKIISISFSPISGELVFAGSDGLIGKWSAEKGTEIIDSKAHGLKAIAISSKALLALNPHPDTIHVYGIQGDQTEQIDTIGVDDVHHFTFSQSGKLIIANGLNGVLKIWDPLTGRKENLFTTSDAIHTIASFPHTERIVYGSKYGRVRLHDLKQETILQTEASCVNSIAISQDEKWIAWGSKNGELKIYNIENTTTRTLHIAENAINSVIFSPNNVLVSGGDKGLILFWNPTTGRSFQSLPAGGPISALAFSPDGMTLASVVGRELKLWSNKQD